MTVLTGCFPQAFPGEALAVEEADIITGSGARRRVLDNVLRFCRRVAVLWTLRPMKNPNASRNFPWNVWRGIPVPS